MSEAKKPAIRAASYAEHKRCIEQNDAEHRKELIGVVAALPGWFRIDIFCDSEETYKTPIVAWELLTWNGETTARHVCYEQPSSGNTWAIVDPSGGICRPDDQSWPTEEAYVKDMVEFRKKMKG